MAHSREVGHFLLLYPPSQHFFIKTDAWDPDDNWSVKDVGIKKVTCMPCPVTLNIMKHNEPSILYRRRCRPF